MRRLAIVMLAAVGCGCSLEQGSSTNADSHTEYTRLYLFTNGHGTATLAGPKGKDGNHQVLPFTDNRTGQSEAGIATVQELGGVAKVFLLVEGAVEVFKSLAGMSAVTTSPTGGVRAVGPAADAVAAPK